MSIDRNFSIQSGIEKSMPQEDTLERRANYRVSFFGTGSDKSQDDKAAVSLAANLAQKIVKDGRHKIVTGGYDSGIMGAASKAAQAEAEKLGRDDLSPEGVTLGSFLGKEAPGAKIKKKETLLERLQELVDASDAMVVLHGKSGTVVELISALWSGAVEKFKYKDNKNFVPKPIIISDSSLGHYELLYSLNARDPKKFKDAMQDVYMVSQEGAEVAASKINFIVEKYYQKKLGQEISNDDQKELDGFSLKKAIEGRDTVSAGGGI